ncbi:MAG: DNA-binding protein [Gemmataceae bacterium]
MATAAKPATKSEIYRQLAEKTGLARKQVASLFDALAELIRRELGKKGPGVFNLAGLVKLQVIHKPATKAREVPNPFRPGEKMLVKAKPARKVVKARPLKALKDAVA